MRIHTAAVFLSTLPMLAEDFWKSKPYTEWTDKEIRRLLTNSPWATEVAAAMQMNGRAGMGGGGGRKGGGMGRGGGMGEGGGGDAGGGMAGGGAPPMIAKLRWQTALPVKRALVKMTFGVETTTSTQAQQLLANGENFYLIVLEGLPQRMAQMGGTRLQENLKKSTMLKRGDKAPILPTDVEVGVAEKTVLIYFAFPKTNEILLQVKDVEFVSKMGSMEFKKKFRLADMIVDGKLTL